MWKWYSMVWNNILWCVWCEIIYYQYMVCLVWNNTVWCETNIVWCGMMAYGAGRWYMVQSDDRYMNNLIWCRMVWNINVYTRFFLKIPIGHITQSQITQHTTLLEKKYKSPSKRTGALRVGTVNMSCAMPHLNWSLLATLRLFDAWCWSKKLPQ